MIETQYKILWPRHRKLVDVHSMMLTPAVTGLVETGGEGSLGTVVVGCSGRGASRIVKQPGTVGEAPLVNGGGRGRGDSWNC